MTSLLKISAFLISTAIIGEAGRVTILQPNISYLEPEGFTRRGDLPTTASSQTVIAYDKKTDEGTYYFHVYYQNFSGDPQGVESYRKLYKSSSEWSQNEKIRIGEWELFYDQFFYSSAKEAAKNNDRKRLFAFYQDQDAGITLTITSTNTGTREDLLKIFNAFLDGLSPKIGRTIKRDPAIAPQSKPTDDSTPNPEFKPRSQ